MDGNNLKPCPFCGGAATFVTKSESDGNNSYYTSIIKCRRCGVRTREYFTDFHGVKEDVNDLIASWNDRIGDELERRD